MARFSSTTEPASSLQPPDGDGVKEEECRIRMENDRILVDLEKRFFELQALNDQIKEDNRRLHARNLELEEKFRYQRRSIEDKEEQIIRLREDAMSLTGTEGRLKEKYERLNDKYQSLREGFESGERKWREETEKIEEGNRRLHARNLELEAKFRDQRRSIEDKEEQIIRLKEDAMSLTGTERRLKEKYEWLNDKYQSLREGFESGERKWREETEKIEVENRRLHARSMELEEKFRDQWRSIEDKEEQIIRLREDAMSLAGTEGRLKEKYERLNDKYQRLREGFESGERKWREETEKIEEKRWKLEVDKGKLEMDLQAARRGADGIGEVVEKMKAVEELESRLEEKDVMISVLVEKNEALEREKMKIEEELADRVIKLEESVAKWVHMTSGTCEAKAGTVDKSGVTGMAMDDFGCNVQDTENGDSKGSGPKSVCISLLEPKSENLEDDVQLKGPDIGKESYAPKSTDSNIVQISDDEEEEKQSSAVASPSTAKYPEKFAVLQKRKPEAVTRSAEKQAETKRSKSDGKLWETAGKMKNDLATNGELCMKSVCALYRKHKSLGVWKYRSDGNKVFKELETRAVTLGNLLTGGDPEGRMKKSVADLEREDPRGLKHCTFIAWHHSEELFEIYSNNLDPFFLP